MSKNCKKRAGKRKPVISAKQIQWEFIYSEPSKETENALDEVLETISLFGVKKGYFGISPDNTKDIPKESSKQLLQTLDIPQSPRSQKEGLLTISN